MTKFSWKAMRIAEHIVKSSGLSFQGMELTIEQVARIYDAQVSAEIEAQHRATWALAIKTHLSTIERQQDAWADDRKKFPNAYNPTLMAQETAAEIIGQEIAMAPCPPIEATAIAELKTNEKLG